MLGRRQLQYRNWRAKHITRRRCSEIVPSSATYSGHWYVPFAHPPSSSPPSPPTFLYPLIPRAALFPCLLLCHLIISRELPSSSSSLSSSCLASPLSRLGFNRNVMSVARRKRRRISAYVRFAIRTVFKGFKKGRSQVRTMKGRFIDYFHLFASIPVLDLATFQVFVLHLRKNT